MKDHYDPWYVQLPDGRVVTAKSTASVRHHVEAGNIPLNSRARRDTSAAWQRLSRFNEFSDLSATGSRSVVSVQESAQLPPSSNGSSPDVNVKSGISARLDPMRLQTVGIRGLVDELIAAFDSTISTGKLVVACASCLLGSLTVFLIVRALLLSFPEGLFLAQFVAGVVGFAILAVVVALLTRQTHLELSTMRPVSPREASQQIGPFIWRVFLGYALTVGVGIGLLVLLWHTPEWVARSVGGINPTVAEGLLTIAWLFALVLAVAAFAIMLLSFLVPPILVVEECSVGDAIREWRALLREHRLRVMVYEGMALALGFVAALPMFAPVQLALRFGPPLSSLGESNWIIDAMPVVLQSIAFGPALAFLAVANLFIYLNLRYEYTPNK
jgi:hypothetical protein